ncbi:hypothetical protein Agabi119p4_4908 [Agaricus bisporus var. burnettii]|uniref:Uncharacterized protein n=1 Tax=Agaricus bisporus var. burnettii TaxID=192524 RepID=A0A8H7F4A9_AGABI|nr:hypothetical protein Agabi119p4_4908 [Agaricus bisporus var. burnettii]
MENPEDAEYSHTQLATLLADSYKDIDTLRRELVLVRKRADKAERMLLNFQTIQQSAADVTASSGPSPDVARMLMELEDRASRAERARDEAEARRRAVHDNWLALERYLSSVDVRTHDARSHFGRMLSGDSSPLSLPAPSPYAPPVQSSSHAFPSLPPHPNPNPGRRPRTPSMDASFQQPPHKRSRGETDRRYPDPAYHPPSYDEYRLRREPRMIHPGGPRSRSRSSEKSISSVDEMLLQATAGESNGTNGTVNRRGVHQGNAYPAVARSHPDSPPYSANRPRVDHSGSLPPGGPSQPYFFTPVVTGAPTKKPKYNAGVTPASSIETPPVQAPPVAAFPPTNAEGQRICRQCGLPGRYKDGKCVEKWGPGPMGPGTVCDRCRKKMKRVERRGTLEQQQLNANALGRGGSHVVVQDRMLQRTDTLVSHTQGNNGSQMSFRTVISNPSGSKSGRAMSPPPAIASLREEEDNAGRTSRSSSRNGRPATTTTTTTTRPPLPVKERTPGGETDADAEAEVDADAEGEGDHEEYEIDDDDEPRAKGRVTADEELLEAVDAAEEAHSTGSQRRYLDDD